MNPIDVPYDAALIGKRIRRVAGLLESEQDRPPIRTYTALLELEGGLMATLSQSGAAPLVAWPASSSELPTQILDGGKVEGSTISGAIVRYRTDSTRVTDQIQFLLLLDGWRIMGLVPTQLGTVLHVEAALSSPMLRREDLLVRTDGAPTTLDDLLLSDGPDS